MTTSINNQTDFDLALNMARQSLYRFTALSLLDPRVGSWKQLDQLRNNDSLIQAASLIRELPEAVPDQLGLGERSLQDLDPQPVLDHLPDTEKEFNQQYENTFGLLVTKACPPYETEYINSKLTFQRSNGLADISGYYKAFGLTTSDKHPERPDHIVLELEFMATLLGLQRNAIESEEEVRQERFEICQDTQVHFLEDHLAWWSPAFGKLLSREGKGGFYETVSIFLSAFIPVERALLGVEVPSQTTMSSSAEMPEDCEGCGLSSP